MILVVEDDADIRDSLVELLRFEGIECLEASNGQEGLELLRTRASEIDLIILDFRLPDTDGATFLQDKTAEPGHASIPVLLASATDPKIIRSDIDDPSVVGILKKPFDLEQLLRALAPFH